MAIKKMYKEIFQLLQSNQHQTINAIMPQIYKLIESKRALEGETYLKDVSGNVVAIECQYFKRWMPLVGSQALQFPRKKSAPSGYNSMCHSGLSYWKFQNKKAKKELELLIDKLERQEITVDEIPECRAEIERQRCKIEGTHLGFSSLDELKEYLYKNVIRMTS